MAGRVIRLPITEPLEVALAAIAQLDRAELAQLHEQIGAVLQATAPPPAAPTRAERVRTQRGHGWIETRFVRDPETGRRYGPYLVRRCREGRSTRMKYLGKRTCPDPSRSIYE